MPSQHRLAQYNKLSLPQVAAQRQKARRQASAPAHLLACPSARQACKRRRRPPRCSSRFHVIMFNSRGRLSRSKWDSGSTNHSHQPPARRRRRNQALRFVAARCSSCFARCDKAPGRVGVRGWGSAVCGGRRACLSASASAAAPRWRSRMLTSQARRGARGRRSTAGTGAPCRFPTLTGFCGDWSSHWPRQA